MHAGVKEVDGPSSLATGHNPIDSLADEAIGDCKQTIKGATRLIRPERTGNVFAATIPWLFEPETIRAQCAFFVLKHVAIMQ